MEKRNEKVGPSDFDQRTIKIDTRQNAFGISFEKYRISDLFRKIGIGKIGVWPIISFEKLESENQTWYTIGMVDHVSKNSKGACWVRLQ